MTTSDFTVTLMVDQSPTQVFNAINDIRGWWIDTIEGASGKLNDEFAVRFEDIHYSKQRLVEFIPNKKVVWLVVDSQLNFLDDKKEWNGTKIVFDISQKGASTEVRFTHQGLVPKIQCYRECSNAWQDYISKSLLGLITKGEGQPYHPQKSISKSNVK